MAQWGERSPFHQYRPGSILACCDKWVEFVVGSVLAPRVTVSPGSPVFLFPHKKTNTPNSRMLDQDKGPE